VYQDLADFPNLAKRVFGDPGRSRRRTPACTGPIGVGEPAAPLADIDNLKAALTGIDAAGAFLSAASPGVISLFFRNDHYASQEAYLFAIAEAMRGEYEAIAAAGVTVQIDCPDLAMGSQRAEQHAVHQRAGDDRQVLALQRQGPLRPSGTGSDFDSGAELHNPLRRDQEVIRRADGVAHHERVNPFLPERHLGLQ
jgi:hypothetical protein